MSVLKTGVELFNRGEYWHAHEQWEAGWLKASEPDATFYKGIIQAAAALVHWQRGNPRGLNRNWQKSRQKLVLLPAHMHGIDLAALIVAMDRFDQADGQGQPPPQPSRG